MLRALERHWSNISIILLLFLLVLFIFLPKASIQLAMAFLLLNLGIAIVFIVSRQMQAYRESQINRPTMFRNIFIEATGLLLAITLAVLVTRWLIAISNLSYMGWAGIVIAIILSVLVGLGARWLVNTTWGKMTKPSASPKN